ncbi:SDR family oxidoreductase [Streptomyces sp. NPDC059262]|uniref:SDR family oxidoreductase n=1 Tax=Streptomyces sp. NPDC059262 TaxID=3346797 RepID=UPI0036CFDFB9
MILVTAATGNIGRPVVRAPAARGAKVRALTRTPDAPQFPDGVEVCDSAAPDFRDVESVLLNLAALSQGPARFLDAAKAAGVRRVVWMEETAVDSLMTYLARSVGRSAPVGDEVPRVLGRPARTFTQWAAEHAGAFRR